MSLSVSNIVRVTVNLTPQAAVVRSFGVLMVSGDSNVINGLERFRSYPTIDAVGIDFGVTTPEYQASALYFAQVPKPPTVMIGRWFSSASSGLNNGGILAPSEQLISNWTAISNGGFVIPVDGTTKTLTGLDFTGVTNLNGVASIISTALSGGSCIWNGQNFEVISDTTGAGASAMGTITFGSNPSYGVQASGTITLSGQPTNGDTVTIKGTVVTFVSGTPSGNQVQISVVDDTHTAENLQAFLQASSDTNLSFFTYNTIDLITTITARAFGTAANAFTLAKSGTNIAVSGATFAGGVAADTLTLNGTVLTFVSSTPTTDQILVGPTATQTAANLQQYLAASQETNLVAATYSTSGLVTTITAVAAGTAGNAYTIAKSSSALSISGATLTGGAVPSSVGFATTGTGTDISGVLKLTAALTQGLVSGFAAETPVQNAAVLANLSTAWYGLMFAASVTPTDDENIDVCDFIEPLDLTRMFGVTIQNTNVLSATITTDLASRMMAEGYTQSFNQYSSTNQFAIASFFGRGFSVDFTAQNTTITLMFKNEPLVPAETLPQDQANTLQAKRCNVFVAYDNDTTIIQFGVMSGPRWWDETHGLDWLQNALQIAGYNVLYTSPTKVPQTDTGANTINTGLAAVCGDTPGGAVYNGLAAPGVWNGPSFGQLSTGQYLKNGFYIFSESVDLQAQADRDARKAPPIQIAIKLAGAMQSLDVLVSVNR